MDEGHDGHHHEMAVYDSVRFTAPWARGHHCANAIDVFLQIKSIITPRKQLTFVSEPRHWSAGDGVEGRGLRYARRPALVPGLLRVLTAYRHELLDSHYFSPGGSPR
jgi:hypothetical protein